MKTLTALCAARRCRMTGFHTYGCSGADCLGCSPRLAADGLDLCWSHREAIARHALIAAELHEELALRLTPGSSTLTEQVAATTVDKGLKIDPSVVEARELIAGILAAWSSLIAEQRGFRPPSLDVRSMAAFIADSASWLAAHPSAADVVDELHELAWGRPRAIAYPSGTRTIKLGDCPLCSGSVRAVMRRPDSLLPSEVACDVEEGHRWRGPSEWAALAELMKDPR